jgi:squalene cyclase
MTSEDQELLQHTLTSGTAYIMSRQDDDGSWVDWQLPPGESRLWTTAFVGYKLRSLPEHLNRNVAPSIRAAARWLVDNRFDDDGWGYNHLVGSDADSTAYAILLLSQSGEPIPETSYARLREFQRSDGGFSTYLPHDSPNSWGVSHPDVTPVALLALLTRYSCGEAFIQCGLDYVLRQRTTAGLWNSFWWESPLYGTEANLSFLNAIGLYGDTAATRESLDRVRRDKPFEVALQLSAALMSSGVAVAETEICGTVSQCVHQLVNAQQADGSWRSEPILRVTNRDCYEPWRHQESGVLFSDPNRLFTSSTVLEALSRIYLHCLSRELDESDSQRAPAPSHDQVEDLQFARAS